MVNRSNHLRGAAVAVVLGCVLMQLAAGPATAPATLPTTSPAPALSLDLTKDLKLDLLLIPAGTFTMGSPETEADRDETEGPQHEVKIAHAFYIGKYEITQAQYQAISGYNQALFKGDDRAPEECVSWTDCQKFCADLSKLTGKKVRLPSEAEWEYAARANTKTAFSTGDSISSTQANFNGRQPYGGAAIGPHRDKNRAGRFLSAKWIWPLRYGWKCV